MSFLDNLENNLKALENLEQGGVDESRRREAERARTLAAAPWAEKLKTSHFVPLLMQQASRAGFPRRMKINVMWIGTALRLEARGHRLELRPTAKGVSAVFLQGQEELIQQSVDLSADPADLLDRWLVLLDEQKKMDDAQPVIEFPED